jgi:hypothetical protein
MKDKRIILVFLWAFLATILTGSAAVIIELETRFGFFYFFAMFFFAVILGLQLIYEELIKLNATKRT